MKHNLLKSLIISVILLTGVSNAWGKTIYLQSSTSTGWAKDNAKFAIHYWKNGGAANWSDYMIAKTSDMYATEISDDATHVIVVRYNSNKTSTRDWNDVWNQTVTIELNGNNIIVDKGWDEEWDNSEKKNKLKNYSLLDGPYETKNLPKKIYFDNTSAKWKNIHLRIGREDYCSEFPVTEKVKGTDNLYVMSIPEYIGYKKFYFANSPGWTGDNQIDQPYNENGQTIPNQNFAISKRTTDFTGNLDQNILFVPTTIYQQEHNCDYYYVDFVENNQPHTQTVNFYQYYAGGTLSISYINEDGNKQTKTSGSFSVPQTCILTVESAVAAPGYEFRNVEFYNSTTKQGDIKTRGETFIVRDARTIYPEFVTTSPQKVFLKINAAWEDYKHIKVYTWNNNSHLWVDLNPVNGVSNLFSCEIPAGYSQLSFVKLNGEDAGGYHWNNKTAQSIDLDYTPVSEGKNCFKLTTETTDDGGNVKYTGGWVSAKVTLDPCNIGTYGIKYNGEEYLNDATTSIEVEMPYGSSFQIIDATPTSEHYIANTRYKTSIVRKGYLTEFEKDQTIEVVDDYNFAPNLVTEKSHRVYLRIPNELRSEWNKNLDGGETFNCIYLRDYLSNWRTMHPSNDDPDMQYGMVVTSNSHETFEAGEDELWYIDIPAGYHTFGFERKNSTAQSTGFANRTIEFEYGIPLDGVNNCFTISREQDGGRYTGSWGPLPTCKIIAGYPDIGSYGIKYNGEVHYATSNPKHSAEFEVPYGAEVEVVESNPSDEAYTNTIGMLNPEEDRCVHAFDFTGDPANNIVTITRKTKFDDLYATKDNKHVVFLAIPKNENRFDKWLSCSDGKHTQGHDIILWQSINTYHYPEGHTYKLHEKEGFIIETDNFLYYKFTLEKNVYRFNFQYKSKNNTTDTGFDGVDAHAGTITSWCPPISTKNCFYLNGEIDGDNHAGGYKGYWDYGPPCKVEMGYTNIGRYGIKDYTGEIHYATPGGTNTTFYVPYGSRVEVLEGEPRSDVYNGMVGLFNGDNVVKKFHDGQNQDNFVTITGYTMFDDLFISKASHIVYLGVPNEGFDNWRLNNGERMTAKIFVPRDYDYSGFAGNRYIESEGSFIIDNITYYKFTLPAGIYKFQFSHRQNDSQISASREFPYQIPVTEYNCFILENEQDANLDYDGYWAKLPKPNVGDYRVLYAEKELIQTHEEGETEDWETAFRTVYEHPSDIIPKGEASKMVSLHINTSQKRDDKTVHPMVILQQFQQMEGSNTYKWVNLQAHTVLPLKATGNMGMLPGRKKAFGDLPFYDNGIEAIKNDTTYSSRLGGLYKGSGVWNFTVTQGVSQSGTGTGTGTTVTLNVGNTTRYTGKYYIRTEALTNGWNNYKDNLMTYSDYADYNSGFSHYFCKWLLVGNNVKFTIANDYAQSISDPLYGDATDLWGNHIDYQMVERDQVLNEDANVRFAWYEMNNFVHRAYLGGSTHVHDRFLVVKGDDNKIFSHYVGEGLPEQGADLPVGGDGTPRYGLYADEEIFRDDANWIYHADVQILPGCSATITAKHYGKEQYFIENAPLVHGYDPNQAKNKYPIRLLYDFKINRLITGYIPNGNNETNIEPFTTNLMLIRKHHEPATQLLFNTNQKTTERAYGVMTFERDFLRDNTKKNKERAAYFISFPFDVKISDVFGFGQFYKHWFIQYYDGESRAQNGLWADTDTYWKHITDPNYVLEAHKGYALLFSLSNIEKSGVLDASKEISLYFPSTYIGGKIGNITDANPEVTVVVPAHVCTIERENRKVKDSNWNLIGVPAYADVSGFVNQQFKNPHNEEVYFYWKRDVAEDTYEVWDAKKGSSLTFQTMHAYMLQYAGVINWTAHTMDPQDYPTQIIARKNTEENTSHTLRITLNQADKKLDQTYVRLQEEDATADFDMNKDQYKIKKAKANIYSLIQNAVGQIEAGANVLPLQTTIVPLGVIIKTAGEYTFAMPDGTDGIVVELIDYETNTRTNMLFDNYTVTLGKGTFENRFALHVQPSKVVTGVDNLDGGTGDNAGVKKYLIDGVLYMQKDGVLYDAQGKLVR